MLTYSHIKDKENCDSVSKISLGNRLKPSFMELIFTFQKDLESPAPTVEIFHANVYKLATITEIINCLSESNGNILKLSNYEQK